MPTRPIFHRPKFQPKPVEHRGTAAQRGYSSDWRRFRAWFLAEHPICAFASTPGLPHRCEVAACIVDHVKPLAQGGERLDASNCRPVCRPCHDVLTQNLVKTGRNAMPEGVGGEIVGGVPTGDRPACQRFSRSGFGPLGGGPARQVSTGGVSNPADGPETPETPEKTAATHDQTDAI